MITYVGLSLACQTVPPQKVTTLAAVLLISQASWFDTQGIRTESYY